MRRRRVRARGEKKTIRLLSPLFSSLSLSLCSLLSLFLSLCVLFSSLSHFTLPTWRSHRQCLKTSRSVRSMPAQQALLDQEDDEGQKSLSATLVVLDGGALVVVDASRSKAAESQPSPRLGGFGDPRLTAQGAIGCCVVQAYVAVVDREKKKERGAFPFAF